MLIHSVIGSQPFYENLLLPFENRFRFNDSCSFPRELYLLSNFLEPTECFIDKCLLMIVDAKSPLLNEAFLEVSLLFEVFDLLFPGFKAFQQ